MASRQFTFKYKKLKLIYRYMQEWHKPISLIQLLSKRNYGSVNPTIPTILSKTWNFVIHEAPWTRHPDNTIVSHHQAVSLHFTNPFIVCGYRNFGGRAIFVGGKLHNYVIQIEKEWSYYGDFITKGPYLLSRRYWYQISTWRPVILVTP